MEATKSAAMESATAVETATPATPSVGQIWLAERGNAQQGSCDYRGPSYPGPGLMSIDRCIDDSNCAGP